MSNQEETAAHGVLYAPPSEIIMVLFFNGGPYEAARVTA